jgi:DNA-directed RNA polymerase subunit RPC12/RpoP
MTDEVHCPACGQLSTLVYRCSECGADLVGRDDDRGPEGQ